MEEQRSGMGPDRLSGEPPLGFMIKWVHHGIWRYINESAREAGLDDATMMHAWVIGYIRRNSDRMICQRDIEKRFNIRKSAVTTMLKVMEKNGYIRRISVEGDARLKQLQVTDKGVELDDRMKHSIDEAEQVLREALGTPEENAAFRAALTRLGSCLEAGGKPSGS